MDNSPDQKQEAKPKKKTPALKRPGQPYPMVEVWWDDASGLRHGWELEVEKVDLVVVLSVGFLVHQTADHIIIAMDVSPDGEHNSRSQIPKGMVKKIKVIREADKKEEKNG